MTSDRASSAAPPRLTRQRQAVLDVVRRASTHPDACWIYDRVRQRIPNISLGTVYRSLAVLRDAGLVLEMAQGGGPNRYDANTGDHQHIVCQECGRVLDLEVGDLAALRERAARTSGFAEDLGERVEFYGRCQDCARKAS